MKTIAAILALAALTAWSSNPAGADTFAYKCKAHGKSSVVRIDDAKKTLAWQGKSYKLTRELTGDECAKFGWRVEGNGGSGDFCTATQGVADFDMLGVNMDCDSKR